MAVKKAVKKVVKAAKKVVLSDAAKRFKALLAEYEAKNPEKYEKKKKELLAKLKNL